MKENKKRLSNSTEPEPKRYLVFEMTICVACCDVNDVQTTEQSQKLRDEVFWLKEY